MRRGRVTKRSTREVNTLTHTHTHTGKWVERTLGETNERELKKSQSTLDSSPLSEECERGSWMERLLLKRCKKKKKKNQNPGEPLWGSSSSAFLMKSDGESERELGVMRGGEERRGERNVEGSGVMEMEWKPDWWQTEKERKTISRQEYVPAD